MMGSGITSYRLRRAENIARREIYALLRELGGAQSAPDREDFWVFKHKLKEVFTQRTELHNVLEDVYFKPDASTDSAAYRLKLGMGALARRCEKLVTADEPEYRKLETEIMSQVRKESKQCGQSVYESLKREVCCWAKARKTGTSEANANAPFWIRRAEAHAKLRVCGEKMRAVVDAAAAAAADAAADEVWRRIEAQKLYTGSATATDFDDEMWTSIVEELCEKVAPLWSTATTELELDELLLRFQSEVWGEGAAIVALCFSWKPALEIAEAVWRGAGPAAEEVWRRAGAANLMKTAEEDYMESLEGMVTRLMAGEGGEEEELRKKQDAEARLVYAVAMSLAVALLTLVYLYLVGLIDRGGTKTYSPGSRVFRSTFASIVLVLGFYIWFKFRDPATRKPARRGYCRPGQSMIEARYKPPRESGNNNYISFGPCATHEEAGIKKEIASFFYGCHTGWLDFEDEHPFCIPSTEQANLSVKEKKEWVKSKVMEVYEDVKSFRKGIAQLGQSGANLGHHLPNPPAEQSEHDPAVAWNLEFRVEDMDPFVDAGSSKFDSPWVTIGLPDAEPQLVQNSSLDLQLALKLVSCLEQRIAEKDRLNEEQARIIVELQREVERLRSFNSQC